MEDVTVPEILNGIHNPAFASQRLPLLELLTNKLGEPTCSALVAVNSDATDAKNDEKKEEKNDEEEPTSNIAPAPSLHSTTLTEEELDALFKTLLTILEKTSCKTLQGRKIVNMALCALSNCTISEAQVMQFLKLTGSMREPEDAPQSAPSPETQARQRQLHFMISQFLEHNPQLEGDVEMQDDWVGVDEWQQAGLVLTNLSQVDDGRRLLLKKSSGYMELIPPQVRSKNPTRRRGAVGCLRSCLFDQDVHWWMLYDIKVLTPILLPLVVATPFTDKEKDGMDPVLWMLAENPDKKMESEKDIMKMLLESIILLCQRRGIREELRKRKVYYVVRNLDLKEEDESISESIYEIVNFLMGDEDPQTPIDTYDESIKSAEKLTK